MTEDALIIRNLLTRTCTYTRMHACTPAHACTHTQTHSHTRKFYCYLGFVRDYPGELAPER